MGRLIDLTGRVFGRLRVLERGDTTEDTGRDGRPIRPRVLWWCLCDPALGGCGTEKQVDGAHLRKSETASCGCYRRDWAAGHEPLPGRPRTRLIPGGPACPGVCRQCGAAYFGPPNTLCCSRACSRAHRTAYEFRRRRRTTAAPTD